MAYKQHLILFLPCDNITIQASKLLLGDSQKLKPVISLVLYYGTDDWEAPRSLVDLLDIPEEWRKRLEPLIADHPIRIVHLAAQDEQTRNKYQSDFRHIVDYLAYVRNKERQKLKEYMGDKRRKVAHPMEYLDLMHAFTNDSRYVKIAERLQENGKESEEINMCIMLDMLEESGIEKGRREEMSHIDLLDLFSNFMQPLCNFNV